MFDAIFREAAELHQAIVADGAFKAAVKKAAVAIEASFRQGGKLLIAGNGGSAADAQHFSAEITGRFKKDRRGYPALALSADGVFLTAWSNDVGFESVFARQVEALARAGDVFFGISTSGNSPNVIEAVKTAKALGVTSVCLLGNEGGRVGGMCDIAIVVPSESTARVQEVHTLIIHVLSEELEKAFL